MGTPGKHGGIVVWEGVGARQGKNSKPPACKSLHHLLKNSATKRIISRNGGRWRSFRGADKTGTTARPTSCVGLSMQRTPRTHTHTFQECELRRGDLQHCCFKKHSLKLSGAMSRFLQMRECNMIPQSSNNNNGGTHRQDLPPVHFRKSLQ
jgi:hypothetical protein